MANRGSVNRHELRAAVRAVSSWLDGQAAQPERDAVAAAVKLSLRTLAQLAPGHSVEVRVPPYAAVQCSPAGDGPRHTRGTPPNVIETDPCTWLLLATGRLSWAHALESARVEASGGRADIGAVLPVVHV